MSNATQFVLVACVLGGAVTQQSACSEGNTTCGPTRACPDGERCADGVCTPVLQRDATTEDLGLQRDSSHDDAPLGAQSLQQGCVTCPRHGARFDVATGEVRRSPAPVGIDTYPVRIKDGWIEADVED